MPESTNSKSRFFIVLGMLLAPVTFLCVRYLDVPVALFVKYHFYANTTWSQMTSTIPDLLLLVVLLSTVVSFLLYFTRSRKGIYDATTNLARVVLWAAPSSYLAKTLLKIVFGRVSRPGTCWSSSRSLPPCGASIQKAAPFV